MASKDYYIETQKLIIGRPLQTVFQKQYPRDIRRVSQLQNHFLSDVFLGFAVDRLLKDNSLVILEILLADRYSLDNTINLLSANLLKLISKGQTIGCKTLRIPEHGFNRQLNNQ